jgi:hypothetical protein
VHDHCCCIGVADFISGLDIEIKVYEIIFCNVQVIVEIYGLVKKEYKSIIIGSAALANYTAISRWKNGCPMDRLVPNFFLTGLLLVVTACAQHDP